MSQTADPTLRLTPEQSQWLAEQEELSRQRVAAMRKETARIIRDGRPLARAERLSDEQFDHDHEVREGWSYERNQEHI